MAYENVFSPIKIGELEIKNRVMIAPMEGTNMIDWLTSLKFCDFVHDYYIDRAKDGVGLMIPGMIPIRSMVRGKWLYKNPDVFKKVKPLMDEIHQYDTKVFFQLGLFSGRNFTMLAQLKPIYENRTLTRLFKPIIDLDANLIACDEGQPDVFMPEILCRQVTKEEIEEFVEAYAQTALLCKKAGVDGVEIHAVHEGYLMDQFTMPYTNHRTDEYGGSLKNRYRFALQVVRRIKKLCGEDYPVSLRYSVTSKTRGFNQGAVPGEDFVEVGRTMEESEKVIGVFEKAGIDMFSCDNGTYDAWFWCHPPVYMPLNCNLEDVKHIKKFTNKPVYCAGRMQIDVAEKEIAAGCLDGVAIGRQFLCDEKFLTKVREGREEDVRPCISCHNGCLPVSTWKGVGVEMPHWKNHRKCALNGRTFEEKMYDNFKPSGVKKFAVIGGGVAGMEFALRAAQYGQKVDLYEKSDVLGGVFISAASMDFKEKDRDLLDWYRRQMAKSDVQVHMNTTITDLSELDADEIIIATGSQARHLNIPGCENAIDAITFLNNQELAGEKVVVIGGGLTGCEIAYQLALHGHKPVIVEMLDDLIKVLGVNMANSTFLKEQMRYHNVPVYLESSVKEIKDGCAVIATPEGTVEVPVDTVITSIGYNTVNPFESQMAKNVHLLGDAEKVGNLRTAIWAADDLLFKLAK